MDTPAGWFDDPTQPGRLRYWDGAAWTEWVSENGETRSVPLATTAPSSSATLVDQPAVAATPTLQGTIPDAGAQSAPAQSIAEGPTVEPAAAAAPTDTDAASLAVPAPAVIPTPGIAPAPGWGGDAGFGVAGNPRRAYALHLLGRAGFALVALAGVVALFATGRAVTRDALGLSGYDMGNTPIALGVVLIIAGAVGMAVPRPFWVRLIALGVASGDMSAALILVLSARTGDQFAAGTDVQLKSGGVLFAVAGAVALAGIVLATFFPARRAAGAEADGGPVTTAKPVMSLVLSLLGLVTVVTAAPAVAAGIMGRDDVTASGGRLSGKGLATAGIVIGTIVFVLYAAGLLISALAATP